MHFVNAKGILSAQNGMNVYRGCTHGCIYCDSRSRCYGFTHDFEDVDSSACGTHIWFQDGAEFFIIGGQGHLHHTFCLFIDVS